MAWLRGLALDVGGIAWGNRWWMTWNTLLAMVPAALGVVVFRHTGRRGFWWWSGVVAFLLFLPNAPYVVTDLVHLRGDVALAGSDAAVYTGVLPLYGAFIAIGFGCYAIALHEVDRALVASGRGALAGRVELLLHALCAIGVLLGRVARLNSWEAVIEPSSTAQQALDTLTWRASPVVLVVLFMTIWLGHATTRVLARSVSEWISGLPGLRPTA